MEMNDQDYSSVHSVTVWLPENAQANGPSHSGHAHPTQSTKSNRPSWWRRVALIWGVSGGTILSVLGFGALTLYQQYNDSLTELRNDLKHFNEASADLVKKEALHNRTNAIWTSIKELQAANQAGTARDTRVVQLERQLSAIESERKELDHELQRMRERLATIEGRLAATPPGVPIPRTDK